MKVKLIKTTTVPITGLDIGNFFIANGGLYQVLAFKEGGVSVLKFKEGNSPTMTTFMSSEWVQEARLLEIKATLA